MKPVEEGGHLITPGRLYTGVEMQKIQGLWMEAVFAQIQHNTMAGIDIKRPDDRLKMEVLRRGSPAAAWATLRSDEVKYVVCDNADRFYPNLQFDHPERYWDTPALHTGVVMRDSLMSEGVYTSADLPHYGQQFLSLPEMLELGIPKELAGKIQGSQSGSGFKCGIYRDFLSADGTGYVLAFAGTEADFQDLASDILQGLGLEGKDYLDFLGFESQYPKAMRVGFDLASFMAERGLSLRMTGHSLGGGLASAAVIAANRMRIPATTFNAAGLHRNTITQRNAIGNLVPTQPAFPNAFEQFAKENGDGDLIVAVNMQYDPLTLLQKYSPSISLIGQIPVAIGKSVTLKGPESAVVTQGAIRLKAAVEKMPGPKPGQKYIDWFPSFLTWIREVGADSLITVKNFLYQHKIKTCHYGLMVEQNVIPARSRKFDIFGYSDPDQQ